MTKLLSYNVNLLCNELNVLKLIICCIELQGIEKQSEVGFMTLLEHLRYCQVGTYLKNPCNPIWVLGSDTHLTGIEEL